MVPKAGLEPARLSPPPPQDGVSTNSTTSAYSFQDLFTFTFLPICFNFQDSDVRILYAPKIRNILTQTKEMFTASINNFFLAS
ncbi:hypothetical protein Lstg_1446 [Legionella steigerwaltii]|uniref:Uncharacterized protein n=1 Tax=Legionella steigerwaltii TaxID=460 RepID=A0ABR5RY56_9GAMM|nr:hypothetical protein Lstg_1446 [Legionella steigerwaltii]